MHVKQDPWILQPKTPSRSVQRKQFSGIGNEKKVVGRKRKAAEMNFHVRALYREHLVHHYIGGMHTRSARNYSPSVGTCAEVTSWDGSSSKDAALASSTSIQPVLSIPLLMEFTAETRRRVESN